MTDDFKLLSLYDRQHHERPIRYFVQDESRFGLKTLIGRLLTAVGIKPIGTWQWLFKAFWIYGAVEPTTGKSFFLQFSHVDTECFQRFLAEFSQTYPDSLNIIQLDNGRFHTSKKLVVPDNIILLFQLPTQLEFNSSWKAAVHSAPPYCPELSPIEHLWQYLKSDLRWASFKTLEELQIKLSQLLAELTPEIIAGITGYQFILDALSVVNII